MATVSSLGTVGGLELSSWRERLEAAFPVRASVLQHPASAKIKDSPFISKGRCRACSTLARKRSVDESTAQFRNHVNGKIKKCQHSVCLFCALVVLLRAHWSSQLLFWKLVLSSQELFGAPKNCLELA